MQSPKKSVVTTGSALNKSGGGLLKEKQNVHFLSEVYFHGHRRLFCCVPDKLDKS